MANSNTLAKISIRFAVAGLLAIACSFVVTNSICSADDSTDFPYQALVAKKDAMVRSGPGKVHYATQKLEPGDAVEVYRHDPGGWCAIRPTKDSFCIIPESTVEIIDEGIGKISADGTTPFVGTALGAVSKPLWQVKLREGENVAVLGQLSWPNPEGHSTIWYQIKPPAGEFRWIHISDIQSLDQPNVANSKPEFKTERPALGSNLPPQNPQLAAIANVGSKPAADSATMPRDPRTTTRQVPTQPFQRPQTSYADMDVSHTADAPGNVNTSGAAYLGQAGFNPIQQASFVEPAEPVQPIQDTGSGWRKATRPIPSSRNFDVANNSTYTNYQQPNNFASSSPQQQRYAAQIRVADASPNRSRFAEQLNQTREFGSVSLTPNSSLGLSSTEVIRSLNNRLTIEMLKDPSTWNLAPIEAAAQQFLLTATPAERIQGQQFLDKLKNCQQVASGYGAPNQQPTQPTNSLGFTSFNSSPASSTANQLTNQLSDTQFDASGWLNELKQASGTAPSTYVLQDATGKIIFHVTPIPGLNINRYLKKKVGITGQRGFNQRLKLNHVSAERVFPL